MTATQTLPAVADNPRRGPAVPPRAASILLITPVLLAGARELVGLWQQAADQLARVGANLGVRCLAEAFGLSDLAVLELVRTTVTGLLTCLLIVPAVTFVSGLVVAVGPLAWARAALPSTRGPRTA